MTKEEQLQTNKTLSLEIERLLKSAVFLLAVNLIFGIWFWVSPNLNNIEPSRSEQMAVAEAKPSPFYFQDERKRPVTKPPKLTPVIVEVEPDPALVAANEFVTTETTRQ